MKYETVDVQIDADAYEAKMAGRPNIKVTLSTFPMKAKSFGSFWLPMTTYDKGRDVFAEAIKARAKHDFKLIIGHYSSCGW